MKRRKFIDASAKIVASSILLPAISCDRAQKAAEVVDIRTNWGGNYTYKAKQLHRPESIEELQELEKITAGCKIAAALTAHHVPAVGR